MTQQQGAEAVLHDAFSSGPAGNQPERSREVKVRKDFSEADQALHLAVSLGTMLLVNGAEINRVEDSMRRVLAAYGAIEPEVFTISSCIIVSVLQEGGQATTRLKRITSRSTDMEKFARLNALSRRLVREKPPYEEAIAALNEILKTPAYPPFVSVFGFFIAAGMFTMLFGGAWRDGLFSGFCALTAWFVVFVAMRLQLHPFLRNIIVSGLSAFLAGAFHRVFPDAKMDLIIIGTFMLQVPGVLMTNGVRDILSGDYIAGFLSLMEAGMVAIAMAIGAAFGLSLVGYL